MLLRHDIYGRLSLVSMSPADYVIQIEAAGPAGARGGAIYDLLLLACARKVKDQRIYTLNQRHFVALAPDLAARIAVP